MAGIEREKLLGAARQLYTELGYAAGAKEPQADPPAGVEAPFKVQIDAEDEALVEGLLEALAKLAGALGLREGGGDASSTLGALDGAALVMRSEIAAGNIERLPVLLPGFAFLVALPLSGKEKALALCGRAEELLQDGARGTETNGGPQ